MPKIYDKVSLGKSMIEKTCIIIGTRPEVVKMSPMVRACEGSGLDYFMVHTGQHYSYNMDRVFFEQLELPDARVGRHGGQSERMARDGMEVWEGDACQTRL